MVMVLQTQWRRIKGDPTLTDSDNDGLSDGEEYALRQV